MASRIAAVLLLAVAAIVAPAHAARSRGVIALYYAGAKAVRVRALKENSCLPDAYYTFRCELPHYPAPGPVTIRINGKFFMRQMYSPYFASKYKSDYVFQVKFPKTRRVHIACWPTRGRRVGVTVYTKCPTRKWRPTKPYVPKPHVPKPHVPKRPYSPLFDRKKCVIIPHWRVKWVNRGWVQNKHGITYMPRSKFGGVYPPGRSPLYLPFTVPRRGRYAVILDSTTTHWTEHNDAWLGIKGGAFHLRRFHKFFQSRRGQVMKAYHNRNGRALESYTVDNDPHSFSTAWILQPGHRYEMIVDARSTQYTLHNIVMFPCNGMQCEYNSAYWKRYARMCRPF